MQNSSWPLHPFSTIWKVLRETTRVDQETWEKTWQRDDGKEGGRFHRVEINMAELDRGGPPRGRIDGCGIGASRSKVKSAWCQRAPSQLPGLLYTPFNITATWICQREPGRRTITCYFKLSPRICVTQCLVRQLRSRQKKRRVRDVQERQIQRCHERERRSAPVTCERKSKWSR